MKLMIVGIDGLDPVLVRRWADRLPVLSSLMADGAADADAQSVFPPDSIPAWATIFTGLSPAQHGVAGHVDYFDSSANADQSGGFREALQGRTFWDRACSAGLRVCVVNPLIAFPPWPVNGVMVSGPLGSGVPSSFPPGALHPGPYAPVIGGIPDFPGPRHLEEFAQRTARDIDMLADYALDLFGRDDFDLRFVTFLQLDRIQHFFWRHMDRDDPTHPAGDRYAGTIETFYRRFDRVVSRFAEARGADDALVVISDHGQRRRCDRVLYVNELLRREGLLVSSARRESLLDRRYATERAKSMALRLAYEFALEEEVFRLARLLPGRRALKTSQYVVGRRQSMAVASTIGGTNPFGGVTVHRQVAEERGVPYEEAVSMVVRLLLSAETDDGVRPVLWAEPREQMYEGPYLETLPDVLFELQPEYGVGFAMFSGLSGPNTMHRRISGGHRRAAFFGLLGAAEHGPLPSRLEDEAAFFESLLGVSPQ